LAQKKYLTKEEAIEQIRQALGMGEEGQNAQNQRTHELIRQKMAEAQTKLQQGARIG
jgi:hypothetical protein